jgi:hypothetical protein
LERRIVELQPGGASNSTSPFYFPAPPRRHAALLMNLSPGRTRRQLPAHQVAPCHQGSAVSDHRQIDGVQARHRSRQNLAPIERRKPAAETRPRSQIPKWHRGHPNAGSSRRLIDLVTQLLHSSRLRAFSCLHCAGQCNVLQLLPVSSTRIRQLAGCSAPHERASK